MTTKQAVDSLPFSNALILLAKPAAGSAGLSFVLISHHILCHGFFGVILFSEGDRNGLQAGQFIT